MILTIDAGNTQIKLAAFEHDEIRFFVRLKTDRNKTEDEYAILMLQAARMHGADPADFEGGILSCVVPKLTEILRRAAESAFHCKIKTVGAGLKTGLNIKIEHPEVLGSDFVCASVAALQICEPPIMVISLGSATTFSVLDKTGSFLGGSIMPGVDISLSALAEKTAQLPFIGLFPPKQVINGGTIDSMNAGMVYGTAGAVDGMIDRYEEEVGCPLTVIATGGNAPAIIPYCRKKIRVENNLVLQGLLQIYKKNKR